MKQNEKSWKASCSWSLVLRVYRSSHTWLCLGHWGGATQCISVTRGFRTGWEWNKTFWLDYKASTNKKGFTWSMWNYIWRCFKLNRAERVRFPFITKPSTLSTLKAPSTQKIFFGENVGIVHFGRPSTFFCGEPAPHSGLEYILQLSTAWCVFAMSPSLQKYLQYGCGQFMAFGLGESL